MDDLAGPSPLEPDETATSGDLGHVLAMKNGDTFLVADPWGDILGGLDGLFTDDTRILSLFRLCIGAKRPSRLSFGLSRDNVVFSFNGANHALPPVGGRSAPRGIIHLERRRCLDRGRLFERLRLTNYSLDEVLAPITFEYAADFRDMFEVRGMRRPARGAVVAPRVDGRSVVFAYEGLDRAHRSGVVAFSESPGRMSHRRAAFVFPLAPGARADLFVEAGPGDEEPPSQERFNSAIASARSGVRKIKDRGAHLKATDTAFDGWLQQSRADVAILTTELATGLYPYAGIPWFSTPFGRDGIITAWQMLWLEPSLAKGVLTYLADRQAQALSAFCDSAPGKIMHETRRGEMAAMKEIPFSLYYGGVDTTPLFVALAGAYLERTDDVGLIERLWPALEGAVGWLETYGDSDGDGLIDYMRGEEGGLSNQGWKDSVDSVFHADGRFAPGPIALVEVQGYAFAAWRAMAAMAERLGKSGAPAWAARAEAIRLKVEASFWMEDIGLYGLARDGAGELCRPETSNPGHLLFVGLPKRERALRVTRRLLSTRFDSGWGIRTLAKGAVRFNPMSYHNGSIWPHDTAIALMGMARYGERHGVAKVLCDLFEASSAFEMRMPELLCGFAREPNEPPIAYPVACRPQAWAAGATFMMLQASLGLTIDAHRREVRIVRPTLPAGMAHLAIDGLAVGEAKVDLRFQLMGESVAVTPGPGSNRTVSVVLEG
jgi:glycogen debranching enzyme